MSKPVGVPKTRSRRLAADELLRPLAVRCSKCGGPATTYPKGTACLACSPAWVESFMLYCLNQDRLALGLAAVSFNSQSPPDRLRRAT